MEGGMAQRAPKGSIKQVLRPILIYLSPRSPNNNQQQPLKNDLHFGGLLRGMLRGYASGYASGVCFARAPPPTNTYLGPREKNTNPYIYCNIVPNWAPHFNSTERVPCVLSPSDEAQHFLPILWLKHSLQISWPHHGRKSGPTHGLSRVSGKILEKSWKKILEKNLRSPKKILDRSW